MADVTISSLPAGTPSGSNLIPYSTGSNTLGTPVSAIFQNATANIGIGTTNPTLGRLQVGTINGVETLGGNGSIKIHYTIDCSPRVELNQSIPGGVGGPSGAGIGFALGSPNQYDALAVRGSAIAVPDPNTDRTLCFYTSDTVKLAERMRIDANGRVGIGTANPTARLDVNGDVRATNTAKAWVNWKGDTYNAQNECQINASYNISKVIRDGAGKYTVYFSTPSPVANQYYVTFGGAIGGAGAGTRWLSFGSPYFSHVGKSTTSFVCECSFSYTSIDDASEAWVSIIGN